MIFEQIYNEITASFGKLWTHKVRNKSLEIITPYATSSRKFVSVFLTERDGEFIVSDGGWISEHLYGNALDLKTNCYYKIFEYYQDVSNIKNATKNKIHGTQVFYKKTNSQIAVPSLVFDLSNFINTMVSMSFVEFSDKENENEQNFNRTAREYLVKIKPKADWYFNEFVDTKKEVRVNAIMRRKNSKLVIMNFMTGSHYSYFRSSIGKTNMIFELANKAKEREFIDAKIALLDNKAKGYLPEHWSIWLNHLLSNTHSQKIIWSKKIELKAAVK